MACNGKFVLWTNANVASSPPPPRPPKNVIKYKTRKLCTPVVMKEGGAHRNYMIWSILYSKAISANETNLVVAFIYIFILCRFGTNVNNLRGA